MNPRDPVSQEADIPNREIALRRLDTLQRNILRLRADIPDMTRKTENITDYLKGVSEDIQGALAELEALMDRQQTWQQWLASRLTLLANLKEFLMVENGLVPQRPADGTEEDGQ